MRIINIFRMDATNTGDWYSPPFRYFSELGDDCMDVISEEMPTERSIIVMGGGGLISHKAAFQRMRRFLGKHLCVGWGLGENWHDEKNLGYWPDSGLHLPDYLKEFDLLGIRDAAEGYTQVPCASCLHPALEEKYAIKRTIGVYRHKRIPIATFGQEVYSNDGNRMEDKIRFLGESEVVLTNSYHGAYWAMLLGRKVICVPFGSKFYGFGKSMVFQSPWELDISDTVLDSLPTHLDYLTECREKNLRFHEAFKTLISR